MLIAISGSQGTGKSTLLDKLKEMGYLVIERKTSRSVLSDWNVTLDQVNSNPDLCIQFQQEILKRKRDDEREAIESNDLWFCERTYVDLVVFNNFNLASRNDYNLFVNNYYDIGKQYSQNYMLVFYLKAGHFPVVRDDVRGINKHYSRMVDLVMEDTYTQMINPDQLIIINTPRIEDRITIITERINIDSNKKINY